MPLLNIALSGQYDDEKMARIAGQMTRLTERHLGKDPALTAITFRNVENAGWFIDGQALSCGSHPSFSLHITVTQGTNTKGQMSDYIDAVFSAMADQIGALRDESYIIIQEVAAANWGYAGRTQEHRAIAAQISPV